MMNVLNRFTSKAAITAGVAALCIGLSGTAQALAFSQISAVYFFGDSLSDSGFGDAVANNPAKAPTVTTFGGYVWSQRVAHDIKGFALPVYPGPNPADLITNNTSLGGAVAGYTTGALTGVNYSAASSTTNSTGTTPFTGAPSLHAQVTTYLASAPPRLDPNAVYFIWSGANDIIKFLQSPPPVTPDVLQLLLLQAAQSAATNIGNEAASLSARGAKRIVVLSMPNIGLTPAIQIGAPSQAGALKNVSFTFNGMLNQELGRVITQYGTKILYIDTFSVLENAIVATNAGKPITIGGTTFLFSNATLPACSAPIAFFCSQADSIAHASYLFADGVHPTDYGHQAVTALVESEIKNWK
jgi:outer membrane lipase/esterase